MSRSILLWWTQNHNYLSLLWLIFYNIRSQPHYCGSWEIYIYNHHWGYKWGFLIIGSTLPIFTRNMFERKHHHRWMALGLLHYNGMVFCMDVLVSMIASLYQPFYRYMMGDRRTLWFRFVHTFGFLATWAMGGIWFCFKPWDFEYAPLLDLSKPKKNMVTFYGWIKNTEIYPSRLWYETMNNNLDICGQ